MDIEILLNFNYEHLKNYLLNSSVDERKKVLSDDRIKNKLINSDYKYDFVFLSQECFGYSGSFVFPYKF